MKSNSEARPSTVFLFYYASIFTILQLLGSGYHEIKIKLQSSFTTDLYHHESCLIKLALEKLNRRQLLDREANSKVIC